MWDDIDNRLSPTMHQIIGFALGVILCAWLFEIPSDKVWWLRLPAAIIAAAYGVALVVSAFNRIRRLTRT